MYTNELCIGTEFYSVSTKRCTQMIYVMAQIVYCLNTMQSTQIIGTGTKVQCICLDCPINSYVYLDCLSNSVAYVICHEHGLGPCIHINRDIILVWALLNTLKFKV